MEAVKQITQEQLETIKKHQSELNEMLINIGIVESQKHSILHALAEVNKTVEEYKKQLEEEYGPINISLEDGSYTAIEKTDE
jgi:predicted  nucleic acid-binding Zn-ribbon protein